MDDCKRPRTNHKQVTVDYNGEDIEVDEDIASLLELLWERGIKTLYSCQGYDYFKDETVMSNRQFCGYILMLRSRESLDFVLDLLEAWDLFHEYTSKALFEVEFDTHPEQGGRITIRFPHKWIQELRLFLKGPVLPQF